MANLNYAGKAGLLVTVNMIVLVVVEVGVLHAPAMLTQSNISEDVQETPLPDINVRVFGESTVLVIEAPRQVSVRAGRVGSSGKTTWTTKLVVCCGGDKVSEVFFSRCHGATIL